MPDRKMVNNYTTDELSVLQYALSELVELLKSPTSADRDADAAQADRNIEVANGLLAKLNGNSSQPLTLDSGNAEVFPGATKEEIASVMMQDLVGDYDTPAEVPEWAWVEREASFNHSRNGQDGIWEFVLNLSRTFEDVPEKLKAALEQATKAHMAYLIIHQGT